MHLQIHYDKPTGNRASTSWIGAGWPIKPLSPDWKTRSQQWRGNIAVDEKVGGISPPSLFTKITHRPVTLKVQARYGENISDVLAISGFGVKDIVNPVTGEQSYTPLTSMAYWGEIHTNGNPQVGVFGGVLYKQGQKRPCLILSNECIWLAHQYPAMAAFSTDYLQCWESCVLPWKWNTPGRLRKQLR